MVKMMDKYRMKTKIFDPWINAEKTKTEFELDIVSSLNNNEKFDLIIVALAHQEFCSWERGKWSHCL